MGLTEFSTNMYTVGSSGTKNVAGWKHLYIYIYLVKIS